MAVLISFTVVRAGRVPKKNMADGEMTLTSKPDSREEGSTSMSEVAGEGGAEPRLMISKIVCENFKSYAGVKELGPFHKV